MLVDRLIAGFADIIISYIGFVVTTKQARFIALPDTTYSWFQAVFFTQFHHNECRDIMFVMRDPADTNSAREGHWKSDNLSTLY